MDSQQTQPKLQSQSPSQSQLQPQLLQPPPQLQSQPLQQLSQQPPQQPQRTSQREKPGEQPSEQPGDQQGDRQSDQQGDRQGDQQAEQYGVRQGVRSYSQYQEPQQPLYVSNAPGALQPQRRIEQPMQSQQWQPQVRPPATTYREVTPFPQQPTNRVPDRLPDLPHDPYETLPPTWSRNDPLRMNRCNYGTRPIVARSLYTSIITAQTRTRDRQREAR